MTAGLKICSLLPSATEIVFALGLGEKLVAVTHECDYPPEAPSLSVFDRTAAKRERIAPRVPAAPWISLDELSKELKG